MKFISEPKLVFLDTIAVRHPSSPYNIDLDEIEFYQNLISNDHFMNSILIASRPVYELIKEWKSFKLKDIKKELKLKDTLLSYFIRQTTNCTPFGYFSSVGTINWKKNVDNKLLINDLNHDVRLDNELLYEIIKKLKSIRVIRENLRYKPNNSIYSYGDQLRYIEEYFNNNELKYKISSIEHMEIISDILKAAGPGIKINDLVSFLRNDKGYPYDKQDILDFLESLIDEQILISNLQINSTGEQPFKIILDILREVCINTSDEISDSVYKKLLNIQNLIDQLINNEIDFVYGFERISGILTTLQIQYDPKKILQIDLYSKLEGGLNPDIQNDLETALGIFSLLPQNENLHRLEEFKKKFLSRYEFEAIPIMEAIDTDAGISFGEFKYQSDNIFLEKAYFATTHHSTTVGTSAQIEFKNYVHKKYIESHKKNDYIIYIEEKELDNFKPRLEKLSPTFQMIISILNTQQSPEILLSTCGNSSAAKLIARFGNFSSEINDTLHEITNIEKEFYRDCIVAEIVHIPEHRIGNVTFRPVIRDYEIPILTQSLLNEEFQIPLNDIYITVRNNLIIIFSKSRKLRIIPKLTNAHNYNKKTSPIYQLLSELEYQGVIPSLTFDLSELNIASPFIPRIQFKNIILHPATWAFKKIDFKQFFKSYENISKEVIENFVKEWNLPNYTDYYNSGTISIINWRSINSVKLFLKYAFKDNVNSIKLREVLFQESDSFIVDQKNNPYFNQCIVFVKNNYANHKTIPKPIWKAEDYRISKKSFPGQEWVYYKLYCGISNGEKFLKNYLPKLVAELLNKSLIKKYFFIRYNDPEYHLRVRFLTDETLINDVLRTINSTTKELIKKDFFWRIQIDTYDRELERYGPEIIELVESIFEIDSSFRINFMHLCNQDVSYILPVFLLRSVDSLLNGFKLTYEEKFSILELLRNSYENEFQVKEQIKIRDLINSKEKELRSTIELIMNNEFSSLENYLNPESFRTLLIGFEQSLQIITVEIEKKVSRLKLLQLIPSIIHMHSIRCFTIRPRENELFAYNILWSHYKKILNKLKLS